jgi:hypothetical protein
LTYVFIAILLAHGIGHLMGFMAAWMPSLSAFTRDTWALPGALTIDSGLGHVLGLLWLAAGAGIVFGAVGLFGGETWGAPVLIGSSILSLFVVLPWAGAMPTGSYVGAIVVDVLTVAGLTLSNRIVSLPN